MKPIFPNKNSKQEVPQRPTVLHPEKKMGSLLQIQQMTQNQKIQREKQTIQRSR